MKQYKYYIIYQIRNLINNKIYIGKHCTNNKNDNYFGSGILITRAIKKYGKQNFEKTILFECKSVEELDKKEVEIVNLEFLARSDVYNIALGGFGGSAKQCILKGKNNVHYGKIHIYNEKTLKIINWPKNKPIPIGWIKGRCPKIETYSEKMEEKYKLWFPFFEEYKKSGYNGVKAKFNYKQSKTALTTNLARYIPEFNEYRKICSRADQHIFNINNKLYTLQQLANITHIKEGTLYYRLVKQKWPIDKAINYMTI